MSDVNSFVAIYAIINFNAKLILCVASTTPNDCCNSRRHATNQLLAFFNSYRTSNIIIKEI